MQRKNRRSKPHINVGTIGHIDHGKTTLTAAITKFLAKSNPKVKFRSSTRSTTRRRKKRVGSRLRWAHVGVRDGQPALCARGLSGHADYIKNMITGRRNGRGHSGGAAPTGRCRRRGSTCCWRGRWSALHRGVPEQVDMMEDEELLELVELEGGAVTRYQFPGERHPVVR